MLLKLFTAVAVAVAGFAGLQESQDLEGVKCIINGKRAADAEQFVEYMGGKVYFCCGGCKAKFVADQELEEPTMTIKANHQLVVTGQFEQTGCPMSGNALAEGAVAEVGGVEVGFCCTNCSGKVNDAEGLEAKAAIVFNAKAFKNGFAKKADLSSATCPISGGEVNAEQFAAHNGGKVYFCCGKCKTKFEEDATPFVAKSNHQLVLTGQVAQTGCPFSGGDMDDDHTVDVGGVSVKMCCGNCVKKVNAADSVEAKAELVFSADAFAKGFGEDE
jgi:YHS domain-containing protein